MNRRPFKILASLLLVALVCAPSSVSAWGGRVHVDISRKAAQSVPDDMDVWRRYAGLMADGSYRPDLWKSNDPTEGPRHYIDVERYAQFGVTNLPRDIAELSSIPQYKPRSGIAPWTILELQGRLTAAMASNDWEEAAEVAAAMGHYVGDIHQPLHTTHNFDGAMADSVGVHLRWESQMPSHHWKSSFVRPGRSGYVKDVWAAILKWTDASHARYDAILEADVKARAAANGNVESRLYYGKLWEYSSDIFIEQTSFAAENLASLWYTAWVDAGRPSIPPPPEKISEASVWRLKASRDVPSAWPFFVTFIVAAIVVVWMSVRKQKKPE